MAEDQKPKEEIVDQNNNGLDDRLERKVEIAYSTIGILIGGGLCAAGALKGEGGIIWGGVTLVALSFALYQGTSIAKIKKF